MDDPQPPRRYRKSKDIGARRLRNWKPIKPRFTLVNLITLVTAFALAFAASRSLGGYGSAIGFLLVWAGFGQLLGKLHWRLGGLAAATLLLSILLISWRSQGTIRNLSGWSTLIARENAITLHADLQTYFDEHQRYPDSLKDLYSKASGSSSATASIPWGTDKIDYENLQDRYTLTFLGRDNKPGGIGLDEDCLVEDLDAHASRIVPLEQFLYDQHRRSRLGPVSVLGLILGLTFAMAFANPSSFGSQPRATKSRVKRATALIGCWVVALYLGCFMASIYLAAGQSSH